MVTSGHVNSNRITNKKGLEVEALLEACQLPSKLTVVKCDAHTSRTDKIAIGNRRAEEMAKAAALVRESVREPHAHMVDSLQ